MSLQVAVQLVVNQTFKNLHNHWYTEKVVKTSLSPPFGTGVTCACWLTFLPFLKLVLALTDCRCYPLRSLVLMPSAPLALFKSKLLSTLSTSPTICWTQLGITHYSLLMVAQGTLLDFTHNGEVPTKLFFYNLLSICNCSSVSFKASIPFLPSPFSSQLTSFPVF